MICSQDIGILLEIYLIDKSINWKALCILYELLLLLLYCIVITRRLIVTSEYISKSFNLYRIEGKAYVVWNICFWDVKISIVIAPDWAWDILCLYNLLLHPVVLVGSPRNCNIIMYIGWVSWELYLLLIHQCSWVIIVVVELS